MCEYCGCQQIATIAELYREHDDVAAQAGLIRSALAGGRLEEVAAGCRQVLVILAPHTVVEEEGLFPEMTDQFPGHIEVLRSDHREIERVLGEAADGTPDDPAWPERVLSALHLLGVHILKEQDGVFPAALIALEAGQWERIEVVRAQNPAYPQAAHTHDGQIHDGQIHDGQIHDGQIHDGQIHDGQIHTASMDERDRG